MNSWLLSSICFSLLLLNKTVWTAPQNGEPKPAALNTTVPDFFLSSQIH
jgi:hypothetical protein